MWQTLSGSGFGAPPMTGFPGEVSGRLRPAKTWRPIEQATMAYGHGISVNLVQLARAYTIFATDGELKPVSLLKVDGAIAGRPVITPRDGARRPSHAGNGRVAGRHGTEGAGRWLSRRRQDRHRAQDRGPRLRGQVRVVVRRFRAGVESASRDRGHDRRARRQGSTTAARSQRRYSAPSWALPCGCSAFPQTRRWTTSCCRPTAATCERKHEQRHRAGCGSRRVAGAGSAPR